MTHLDGNAIAGVLEQLFGRDLTLASSGCTGCGAVREVAEIHVYRSAGIVARCPDCDMVLFRIVEARDRMWIDFRGFSSLQVRS